LRPRGGTRWQSIGRGRIGLPERGVSKAIPIRRVLPACKAYRAPEAQPALRAALEAQLVLRASMARWAPEVPKAPRALQGQTAHQAPLGPTARKARRVQPVRRARREPEAKSAQVVRRGPKEKRAHPVLQARKGCWAPSVRRVP
jgi:hypothetical protein